MFRQMKSRPRYVEVELCACEDKCPCHNPKPKKPLLYELLMCTLAALCVVTPIAIWGFGMMWYQEKHPPAIRYIEVNGQMCEIQYKETHRSSWGSSRGHDIAVCK